MATMVFDNATILPVFAGGAGRDAPPQSILMINEDA
jgi:hypothetical protein